MNFKFLLVDSEKISYRFTFFREKEEILDYGIEFIDIKRFKSIDYLFAILQVTKDLAPELREQILYRTLISEYREEYFLERFNFIFETELELDIELDNLDYNSDHTSFSLDSWYYNSD